MSAFNAELRECLEIVVGTAPPEPDCEPLVFFRQWLAARNLGLVPIANARKFDWPGHWIARVRADDGDHAIVMFGSPSGPLHDPTGALASGGTIEEGWLLARLDVRLPIEQPYGHDRRVGSVVAILMRPTRSAHSLASTGSTLSPAAGWREIATTTVGERSAVPDAGIS